MECVANFSEGRDRRVIDRIAGAMDGVSGARVLHVDPGVAAHRTVITAVGAPDAIVACAAAGVREAVARIDMRSHRGVHPRLGAADVVPLVPLRGVSMETCVGLARRLGAALGRDPGVPVYLYGAAAPAPERASLARVRRGQWEALPKKLERLPPDFGPRRFSPSVARSGATVVGARPILVAWNLTLDRDDPALARELARQVRASAPGGLPGVRAIGWSIAEYGRSQVSTNIVDWRATSPHALTAAVRRLAAAAGARVVGAELIGLVPEAALLADDGLEGRPTAERLSAAVETLGLDHLGPITLDAVVLERALLELGGGAPAPVSPGA